MMIAQELMKVRSPVALEFFRMEKTFFVCGNKQTSEDCIEITPEKIRFYKNLAGETKQNVTLAVEFEEFLNYWRISTDRAKNGYDPHYYIPKEYSV